MIQLRSIVNVADNSGARKVQCFKVRGGHHRDIATLGDVVMCSVRDAIPTSAFKKGDVVRAVVVRVAREKRRKDGSYIRFDDNAVCIINDNGETQRYACIRAYCQRTAGKELPEIISLAPEVGSLMQVKKKDTVLVLTGKDKGKKGEVKSVNPSKNTVTVVGINMIPNT